MKCNKRMLSLLCAAALSLTALSSAIPNDIDVVASDDTVLYEFEDGVLSNCEYGVLQWTQIDEDALGNVCDTTGWSGDGFVYVDQKGASASVTVNVETAGLYQIDLCYIQCFDANKKVQYFNVNGSNQGDVSFPFNSQEGWSTLTAGYVQLQEGANTIEIKSYWGYTLLDYLTVSPAPEYLSSLSPTRTLTNENASDNAKRLYTYLCDVYGEHIISGQQEKNGSHCYNINSYQQSGADFSHFEDNEEEFDYILSKTGKTPAIRGIDFLAYNTTIDYDDYAADRVIEWYNDFNGIPTVSWHWCVPSEEGGTTAAFYVQSANATYTTFSISRALTEGTWENEVLMADIALFAQKMQKVEDAGVPVIFRPLHEAEGAWFWWGAEGPEYCVELYRLLYDQLTNVYGLDNLIWEWTSYTYDTSPAWYPGDDVVDIVSYDKYNVVDYQANLSAISATFYTLVDSTKGEKLVAMSENDTIPSLENIQNEKASWLYFCPWYGNYITTDAIQPVDNLIEMYQSEYCITLDELPDLKTYSLDNYGTDEPEEQIIYGDANGDGIVNSIDATMVTRHALQVLTLSDDAQACCDVNLDGVINSIDATIITRYALKVIETLPV